MRSCVEPISPADYELYQSYFAASGDEAAYPNSWAYITQACRGPGIGLGLKYRSGNSLVSVGRHRRHYVVTNPLGSLEELPHLLRALEQDSGKPVFIKKLAGKKRDVLRGITVHTVSSYRDREPVRGPYVWDDPAYSDDDTYPEQVVDLDLALHHASKLAEWFPKYRARRKSAEPADSESVRRSYRQFRRCVRCFVREGHRCDRHRAGAGAWRRARAPRRFRSLPPVLSGRLCFAERLRLHGDAHHQPVPAAPRHQVRGRFDSCGLAGGGQDGGARDGTGETARPGEAGEIVVGGRYLSPGYWNRRETTAQAFTEAGGERWYRTGDIGMWREDGCLLHLGRTDEQVKIRGHRVELAEVEKALADFPSCQEAAIAVRHDAEGAAELVAYMVSDKTEPPVLQAIRAHLEQRLPSYMKPRSVMLLDALPRLANGKPDAQKLAAATGLGLTSEAAVVAPGDALEQTLMALAQEVLGLNQFGIRDDFFHLGCDSLRAVQFLARVERELRRRISPEVFFRNPTVAGIAAALRERLATSREACVVPIQSTGSRAPLFCFPGASGEAGSWFQLARGLGREQPVYSLEARGLNGKMMPHRTVKEMAAYYAAAIGNIHPDRPVNLLGYSLGGVMAQECARQLASLGRPVNRLVLLDALDIGRHRRFWQLTRHYNLRLGDMRRAVREGRLSGTLLRKAARGGRRLQSRAVPPQRGDSGPKALVREAIRGAVREHRPLPFSGSAIYVEASETGFLLPQNRWAGWRRLVEGNIDVYQLPGDHVTMLNRENTEALARRLRDELSVPPLLPRG